MPVDRDHLFSFIDTDDSSTNTVVDSPIRGVLETNRDHRPEPEKDKLNTNSFLSLESTAPSPISPLFQRRVSESVDRSLCFVSAEELLGYVTRNWRHNFVTQDLRTEQAIQMFIKRPFFMLVSIDGPILDRFRRANTFVPSFPSSYTIYCMTLVFTEARAQGCLSTLLYWLMTLMSTVGGVTVIIRMPTLRIPKLNTRHPSTASRNT